MPSHTADVIIHGEKASPILNMAKHATSTASKNIIKKAITILIYICLAPHTIFLTIKYIHKRCKQGIEQPYQKVGNPMRMHRSTRHKVVDKFYECRTCTLYLHFAISAFTPALLRICIRRSTSFCSVCCCKATSGRSTSKLASANSACLLIAS